MYPTFFIIYHSIILRMRNISKNVVEMTIKHILPSKTL